MAVEAVDVTEGQQCILDVVTVFPVPEADGEADPSSASKCAAATAAIVAALQSTAAATAAAGGSEGSGGSGGGSRPGNHLQKARNLLTLFCTSSLPHVANMPCRRNVAYSG